MCKVPYSQEVSGVAAYPTGVRDEPFLLSTQPKLSHLDIFPFTHNPTLLLYSHITLNPKATRCPCTTMLGGYSFGVLRDI
jgi:hypothetical protein